MIRTLSRAKKEQTEVLGKSLKVFIPSSRHVTRPLDIEHGMASSPESRSRVFLNDGISDNSALAVPARADSHHQGAKGEQGDHEQHDGRSHQQAFRVLQSTKIASQQQIEATITVGTMGWSVDRSIDSISQSHGVARTFHHSITFHR